MTCNSPFNKNPGFVCLWPECSCVKKSKKKSRFASIVKGKRKIGEVEAYFKSLYEMNFARVAEYHRTSGTPFEYVTEVHGEHDDKKMVGYRLNKFKITGWQYETRKYWFDANRAAIVRKLYRRTLTGIRSGVVNYTPDFILFGQLLDKKTDEPLLFNESPTGVDELIIEVKGYLSKKDETKLRRMAQYYPEVEVILIGNEWFKSNSLLYKSLIPDWETKSQIV